jgi:hypothetical protein
MTIEIVCSNCGATLDDRWEHDKVVVEPCECTKCRETEYHDTIGPDYDEKRALMSICRGWR